MEVGDEDEGGAVDQVCLQVETWVNHGRCHFILRFCCCLQLDVGAHQASCHAFGPAWTQQLGDAVDYLSTAAATH